MLQWQSMTSCLVQWHKRNMHWTGTACCFTCHMNWTFFIRTPSGTWLEAREADAQLACKLAVDITTTSGFIICLDMWHDHPGKFVLTFLNVLTFVAETVCCHLWFETLFWVSAHFSCVKEANNFFGYWLSLK